MTTPPHDEKRLQRLRAKASRLDEEIRQLEEEMQSDEAAEAEQEDDSNTGKSPDDRA